MHPHGRVVGESEDATGQAGPGLRQRNPRRHARDRRAMQTRLRAASCRKSSRAAAQQCARSQTSTDMSTHTDDPLSSTRTGSPRALRMNPPLSHRRASRAGLRCLQQTGMTPRLAHASHVQSLFFLLHSFFLILFSSQVSPAPARGAARRSSRPNADAYADSRGASSALLRAH
jgi:hypothetical protein